MCRDLLVSWLLREWDLVLGVIFVLWCFFVVVVKLLSMCDFCPIHSCHLLPLKDAALQKSLQDPTPLQKHTTNILAGAAHYSLRSVLIKINGFDLLF